MGQYWVPVNLTKREFLDPHKLGSGLKAWEQLANRGTGRALVLLLTASPERRGGGDFSLDMGGDYGEVTRFVVGRWAGDKVALVGDYGVQGDIKGAPEVDAGEVYTDSLGDDPSFYNITPAVCAVIESEMDEVYVGDGWRESVDRDKESAEHTRLREEHLREGLECVRSAPSAPSLPAAHREAGRKLLLEGA